jgi:hypothetical protein
MCFPESIFGFHAAGFVRTGFLTIGEQAHIIFLVTHVRVGAHILVKERKFYLQWREEALLSESVRR